MKQTFGRKSATGSRRLPVLFDGWPLVSARGSPAALHLLELFEALPAQVEPWLALPSDDTGGSDQLGMNYLIDPVPNTPAGRLRWEQVILPRLARKAGARLLHTTSLSVPLLSPVPCLVSPAEPLPSWTAGAGFLSRLRASLNQGGQANISAVLWPDDLPDPPGLPSVVRLPPLVHSAFNQVQPPQTDFPGDFVFCPGPLAENELELLITTWERASAGLGADWALLVSNLTSQSVARLKKKCQSSEIDGPVEVVELLTPARCAAAVQQARLVLAVGPLLPWGDGTLQALACARPLAAQETTWSSARTGPAGYLAPPQDARTLAAAVITPLVEEQVYEQLSQAAVQQAAGWLSAEFSARLWNAYQQAVNR